VGKYLCYGLLAISVDLLWGYTGLLSLGQALFFSFGGYMLGMNLMLMIGPDGQWFKSGNNPEFLPDFMVFQGYQQLPSFWKPFYSFPFAVAMVFLVPGVLALVFGFLAFRSRIKGVYFSILTQALTYASPSSSSATPTTMGGNNGFTDFKRFVPGWSSFSSPFAGTAADLHTKYGAAFDIRQPGTSAASTSSPPSPSSSSTPSAAGSRRPSSGLVQRAVRDSETRVLFSGYAAANYKLFVFVAASIIGAVGGALYVPQAGIINPSEMWTDKSLEVVVWCAVGGRGTLIGPIIGAIGVNSLKSWGVVEHTYHLFGVQNWEIHWVSDYWLILEGVLFILIVLFMPKASSDCSHRSRACSTNPSPRRKPLPRPNPPNPRNRRLPSHENREHAKDISARGRRCEQIVQRLQGDNNLNFYLDPGELRTVIGPNGAGKTSFLDLITGRTKPDTGTIQFEGKYSIPRMKRVSDLPSRDRPQISDPHRLYRPYRVGEPPPLP